MAMNDMIEFQRMTLACDELITLANDINNTKENDTTEVYKKVALSLLNIKACNRKVHNTIETKKKEVENYKEKVDRLRLQLENLLYKKAYLKEQIKLCKDLDTPNLSIVENDVNNKIALREYPKKDNNDDISIIWKSQSELAMEKLNKEMDNRKELQQVFDETSNYLQNHVDIFDKKRKLLDTLPERMQKVKDSTAEIEETLTQARNIVLSSVTEVEMTN